MTSANIWFIRRYTDLRTQIIDLLTNVFYVVEEKKARFKYEKGERKTFWHDLLSSDSTEESPSRMSEQQSSMMSSQGEPNEKPSVEHCWLVEPITKPILQASQQSWGLKPSTSDERNGWKFNDVGKEGKQKLNGFLRVDSHCECSP